MVSPTQLPARTPPTASHVSRLEAPMAAASSPPPQAGPLAALASPSAGRQTTPPRQQPPSTAQNLARLRAQLLTSAAAASGDERLVFQALVAALDNRTLQRDATVPPGQPQRRFAKFTLPGDRGVVATIAFGANPQGLLQLLDAEFKPFDADVPTPLRLSGPGVGQLSLAQQIEALNRRATPEQQLLVQAIKAALAKQQLRKTADGPSLGRVRLEAPATLGDQRSGRITLVIDPQPEPAGRLLEAFFEHERGDRIALNVPRPRGLAATPRTAGASTSSSVPAVPRQPSVPMIPASLPEAAASPEFIIPAPLAHDPLLAAALARVTLPGNKREMLRARTEPGFSTADIQLIDDFIAHLDGLQPPTSFKVAFGKQDGAWPLHEQEDLIAQLSAGNWRPWRAVLERFVGVRYLTDGQVRAMKETAKRTALRDALDTLPERKWKLFADLLQVMDARDISIGAIGPTGTLLVQEQEKLINEIVAGHGDRREWRTTAGMAQGLRYLPPTRRKLWSDDNQVALDQAARKVTADTTGTLAAHVDHFTNFITHIDRLSEDVPVKAFGAEGTWLADRQQAFFDRLSGHPERATWQAAMHAFLGQRDETEAMNRDAIADVEARLQAGEPGLTAAVAATFKDFVDELTARGMSIRAFGPQGRLSIDDQEKFFRELNQASATWRPWRSTVGSVLGVTYDDDAAHLAFRFAANRAAMREFKAKMEAREPGFYQRRVSTLRSFVRTLEDSGLSIERFGARGDIPVQVQNRFIAGRIKAGQLPNAALLDIGSHLDIHLESDPAIIGLNREDNYEEVGRLRKHAPPQASVQQRDGAIRFIAHIDALDPPLSMRAFREWPARDQARFLYRVAQTHPALSTCMDDVAAACGVKYERDPALLSLRPEHHRAIDEARERRAAEGFGVQALMHFIGFVQALDAASPEQSIHEFGPLGTRTRADQRQVIEGLAADHANREGWLSSIGQVLGVRYD